MGHVPAENNYLSNITFYTPRRPIAHGSITCFNGQLTLIRNQLTAWILFNSSWRPVVMRNFRQGRTNSKAGKSPSFSQLPADVK
jgi:hypothetical protein